MGNFWRKQAFLKVAAQGSYILTKLALPMVDDDVDCMLVALYGAAAKNQKKIAALLIDAGTPVDKYDPIGYTPLHIAALNGNKGVMEVLLDKGVDVNAASRGRLDTALHLLAGGRTKGLSPRFRVDAIKLLIDRGAAVNQQNMAGNSALFLAIWHVYRGLGSTNLLVAEVLIESGADVLLQNQHGETPLVWARLHRVDEIINILVDAEDKVARVEDITNEASPVAENSSV